MRRVLKQILQILDGTPAVYGSPVRGQSVVELVLVTPLLIMLIMGLAEIGWFANNFLILLETARIGARYGTVQTNDTSPLNWNNAYSLSPDAFPASYGIPNNPPANDPKLLDAYRRRKCSQIKEKQEYQGFYNVIACVMLNSMSPLPFRSAVTDQDDIVEDNPNNIDDIVISAFSLQTLNVSDSWANKGTYRTDAQKSLVPGIATNQQQVLVVGRFPTNANECTVNSSGGFYTPAANFYTGTDWQTWDNRDPFDYIQDNGSSNDYILINNSVADTDSNRFYLEMIVGRDPLGLPKFGVDSNIAADNNTWERQRGWSLTGQHRITNTNNNCVGSEWTMAEVQQLINLPQFNLVLKDERARLPSQGIVMVEMFWDHQLLLKNPIFNPVWTLLGNRTTISVWAAFPVPAVEPRIRYTSDR